MKVMNKKEEEESSHSEQAHFGFRRELVRDRKVEK